MGSELVERYARVALFLALAAASLIVPLGYFHVRQIEAAAVDALAAAAQKEKQEKATGPTRLGIATLGTFLSRLSPQTASASIYVTNVSSRSGVT